MFIGKLDTHLLVIHMNALGLIPCHHVMEQNLMNVIVLGGLLTKYSGQAVDVY